MPPTVIVDYGMGNIGSVQGALDFIGESSVVVSDPKRIKKAKSLVLPGVGSFSAASKILESSGLMEAIQHAVLDHGSKILGICLGMQLLGVSGEEGGKSSGLGLTPGHVEKFPKSSTRGPELHIGFSGVEASSDTQLFRGLPRVTDFYFVHEYRFGVTEFEKTWAIGHAVHSERFVASIERENVMGVQFHPEKSQTNGLMLLRNFIDI